MATTAGWVELEIRLPGGPVEQNIRDWNGRDKGDCFSACVSMLTGIDLDLLPVHPPLVYLSGEEWIHITPDEGDLRRWRDLLADNGFDFHVVPDDTSDVVIQFIFHTGYRVGHAVILVDNEFVIDPLRIHGRNTFEDYEQSGWVPMSRYVVTPL